MASAKWLIQILLFAIALPAYAAQDLLVEVDLDQQEVHVLAQAVYRLRFLHAVDVRDVQIAGPSLRLADLRKIGEDKTFEAWRDGKRYRVHERRYAVFPIASGTLALAGAHVSGRIPAPTAALPNGWQALRLDAPSRTLTVLPADIRSDGAPWLPAHTLTLTEQWTTVENGVHRRKLRIEATGVEAAQLPELEVDIEGMGVLAGTPRLQNHFAGERNVAVREQTFVIMPVRSGLFKVPPLQLQWWDVDTASVAVATLPARTLLVGEPVTTPNPASGSYLEQAALRHVWAMLTMVAAALLFAGLRSKRLWTAWRLQQACRASDPHAVRDRLLEWAATVLPDPPQTLDALADRMRDGAAGDAVRALEHSLHSAQVGTWDAGMLKMLVSRVKRDTRRKQ